MTEAWLDFFAAQVGASAPPLGLLFVGVSLNLQKILTFPLLPDRALVAMGLLLSVLLTSSAVLVPGQPAAALGAESLVIGAVLWGYGCFTEIRAFSSAPSRAVFFGNFVLFQLAALPYLVGGVLLLAGSASGLYWLAAATLASTVKAVLDAWVLLVEINR